MKKAAVFPAHYPREIIRAFGILPIEVWNPPVRDTLAADSHFQPYICSLIRNGFSFLEARGVDDLEFILIPHNCDSLQGLGSLFYDMLDFSKQILTIYMPRSRREIDISFYADELKNFYEKLADITNVKPDEESLFNQMKEEVKADELVNKLMESRVYLNMTNKEFYELLKLRIYNRDLFISKAKAFMDATESYALNHSVKVILSGIFPHDPVIDILDESQAVICADDTVAIGRRVYGSFPDERDIFLSLSRRMFNGPPDSLRGDSVESRANWLLSLAKKFKADGVIFCNIKFCEAEAFYVPMIKSILKDNGLPSIYIETELGSSEKTNENLRNRIMAFMEMIQK